MHIKNANTQKMQTLGHARRRHAWSHLLCVHGVRCLCRAQTAFLVIGVVFLVARKTERQSSVGTHRRRRRLWQPGSIST